MRKKKNVRPHTLLHSLVLRQLGHVFIQQISQRLSVGQQLLVGSGKFLVLLVSVLAQLSFGMQDPPEEDKKLAMLKQSRSGFP